MYRLEKKGWIDAEWGLSEKNRRTKYYRLTAQGRAGLRSNAALWTDFTRAVATVLQATTGPASA